MNQASTVPRYACGQAQAQIARKDGSECHLCRRTRGAPGEVHWQGHPCRYVLESVAGEYFLYDDPPQQFHRQKADNPSRLSQFLQIAVFFVSWFAQIRPPE